VCDARATGGAHTDGSGAVTGTANYDPYGQLRSSTGTATSFGYTGAAADIGGNLNLQAREYNPTYGQFLQADTYTVGGAGTTGYNHYTYTTDNPSSLIDPSGHVGEDDVYGGMPLGAILGDIADQSALRLLLAVTGGIAVTAIANEVIDKALEYENELPAYMYRGGTGTLTQWTIRKRDLVPYPLNGLSFFDSPARVVERLGPQRSMWQLDPLMVQAVPGLLITHDPTDPTHYFVTGRTPWIALEWAETRDTAEEKPSNLSVALKDLADPVESW
jgi:RHS repeat-associated protein